jgi:hypothetical protein
MAAVKLFKKEQLDQPYKELPVTAYLPSFLSGEPDKKNIEKRIINTFLKSDQSIIKAGWHYQDDETTIYWLDNSF